MKHAHYCWEVDCVMIVETEGNVNNKVYWVLVFFFINFERLIYGDWFQLISCIVIEKEKFKVCSKMHSEVKLISYKCFKGVFYHFCKLPTYAEDLLSYFFEFNFFLLKKRKTSLNRTEADCLLKILYIYNLYTFSIKMQSLFSTKPINYSLIIF